MDASAYLKRHGWRGDGHSLDLTDRGIRRPLLVSKKIDVLGLGVNKHAAVSDQWWMRAFDQGLRDLGSGKESTLASVRKHGSHHGGLYGRFVKGESVPGTFGSQGWSSLAPVDDSLSTPADSGVEVHDRVSEKKKKREGNAAGKLVKSNKRKLETQESESTTTEEAKGASVTRETAGESLNSKDSQKRKMSSTKAAEYQKRAESKGMTMDEYITRRERKYAEKKAKKSKQPP